MANMLDKLANYRNDKMPTEPVKNSEELAKFFDKKTPVGYYMHTLHRLGFKVIEEINGEWQLTEFAKMLLCEGDALCIAGAGSGKTTAVVFKILKDILTGEATKTVKLPNGNTVRVVDSMFVGTFLRTAAEELKKSVEKWQKKLKYTITADSISFGTLHAEFKRALESLGVKITLGSKEELSKLFRASVKELSLCKIGGVAYSYEDYMNLESVVAYYRNRVDRKKYEHPSMNELNLTPTTLDMLASTFAAKRQARGIQDYEDFQELLYKYLYSTPNPKIQEFIANRYKFIYLDEFQDTSQIQYEILKFYARGRVAINRGLSEDFELVSSEELNKNVVIPQSSKLILNFENLQTPENPQKRKIFKDLKSDKKTGGKLVVIGDDDQSIYSWRGSDIDIICNQFNKDFKPNEVMLTTNYRCPTNILNPVIPSIMQNKQRFQKILKANKEGGEFNAFHFGNSGSMIKHIMNQINEDMAAGRSVAILCRTNADAILPVLGLEVQGKYEYSVSSFLMTLNNDIPKKILDVAKSFTSGNEKIAKTMLEMLLPRGKRNGVAQICEKLSSERALGNKSTFWKLPIDDIVYSCPNIEGLIRDIRYLPDGQPSNLRDIDKLIKVYWYLFQRFWGNSPYAIKMRGYIDLVLNIIKWKRISSVEDLVIMLENFCEQSEGRVGGKNKKITIATVHEFKGKERDSVYIWQDSLGYFPASKADSFIQAEIEEERRVHYIACTRAKQKCTIYALNNLHGMFLNEMDCAVTEPNEIKGELNCGKVTQNEADNAPSNEIKGELNCGKVPQNETDNAPSNEIKGELNCGKVTQNEVKDLAVG